MVARYLVRLLQELESTGLWLHAGSSTSADVAWAEIPATTTRADTGPDL